MAKDYRLENWVTIQVSKLFHLTLLSVCHADAGSIFAVM